MPEQTPNGLVPNESSTRPPVHLWKRAKFQGSHDGLLETWCGQRVEGPLVCLDPARATCGRCVDREAAERHGQSWRSGTLTGLDLGIVAS